MGATSQIGDVRVGLFPPLEITNLRLNRPGQAQAVVDRITVRPIFWGPHGPALGGRVGVEGVRITLPASLEFRIKPSVFDIDPDRFLVLRSPVEGLTIERTNGPEGPALDLAASLPLDRLVAFSLEGVPNGDLGDLAGEAHAARGPGSAFNADWTVALLGARTTGRLGVMPGKAEGDLSARVTLAGLDFARLFKALGRPVEEPLGSLSGTVSLEGPLDDPKALAVDQQITFTRPEKRPAAVTRLRGDFAHEVTTSDGTRRTLQVSPASPDFIALLDVPPLFIRALLIAEDAAFFSHPGIDLAEMPRAIAINWARGEAARGASTLTQQLAKNLFLTREKSLHRKLRELSYSFLLESTLGKNRILEIYLNIIEWGPGLYGLRPAARHYFGREPQALTPREIAFLVSMIPGPIKYQRSIEGGELRPGFEVLVNNLLVKLRSVDALTEEQYLQAREEKLAFRGAAPTDEELARLKDGQ